MQCVAVMCAHQGGQAAIDQVAEHRLTQQAFECHVWVVVHAAVIRALSNSQLEAVLCVDKPASELKGEDGQLCLCAHTMTHIQSVLTVGACLGCYRAGTEIAPAMGKRREPPLSMPTSTAV